MHVTDRCRVDGSVIAALEGPQRGLAANGREAPKENEFCANDSHILYE